jgi:uncharacterized protein YlzI (FlbEa/FlbD family)
MIFLTKLDKSRVLVTLANLKYIEATPDTLLRFVNGDMLIVCETLDEIEKLAAKFKARCLRAAATQHSEENLLEEMSHRTLPSHQLPSTLRASDS